MYERAVEMGRMAAVDELVGTDLPSSEVNYWTAILMLEAVLEDEDDGSQARLNGDEWINGLEKEDRKSIQSRMSPRVLRWAPSANAIRAVLESMKERHITIKRKIEVQKTAKRASVTSMQARASQASNRSSPSAGSAK